MNWPTHVAVAAACSAMAICLGAAGASAQEGAASEIRVSGEAVISAEPDQALLDVGVVTEAKSGDEAASRNASQVDAVITALKRVLAQGASGSDQSEVRTISYSLQPRYRTPRPTGERELVGYEAQNVVRVKTTRLDRVGALIDSAVKSGSNRVQQLSFGLRDEQPVRARALREAALRAREKARAIAAALELEVVRVLLVEEVGASPGPIRYRAPMMMQAEAAAATPVEPGTIDVRGSVTLTVAVQ